MCTQTQEQQPSSRCAPPKTGNIFKTVCGCFASSGCTYGLRASLASKKAKGVIAAITPMSLDQASTTPQA